MLAALAPGGWEEGGRQGEGEGDRETGRDGETGRGQGETERGEGACLGAPPVSATSTRARACKGAFKHGGAVLCLHVLQDLDKVVHVSLEAAVLVGHGRGLAAQLVLKEGPRPRQLGSVLVERIRCVPARHTAQLGGARAGQGQCWWRARTFRGGGRGRAAPARPPAVTVGKRLSSGGSGHVARSGRESTVNTGTGRAAASQRETLHDPAEQNHGRPRGFRRRGMEDVVDKSVRQGKRAAARRS